MDADRRRRFVAYFEGPPFRGDRAKLIARTKYTKGRVAQYFDESQPFGERAARELASRLGLDGRYFERDATGGKGDQSPIGPPVVEITETDWGHLQAFKDMSEEDAAYIAAETERRHQAYKRIREEVLGKAGIKVGDGKPHGHSLPIASPGTVLVKVVRGNPRDAGHMPSLDALPSGVVPLGHNPRKPVRPVSGGLSALAGKTVPKKVPTKHAKEK